MSIESENDLICLRKIGRIVANCLQHMASQLEPGITTLELDEVGRIFLEGHGVGLQMILFRVGSLHSAATFVDLCVGWIEPSSKLLRGLPNPFILP